MQIDVLNMMESFYRWFLPGNSDAGSVKVITQRMWWFPFIASFIKDATDG